ncbi:MAG: hypothetical protein B7Y68_08995, partial [Thiotrichales bacterium 35-46-9]
GKLERDILVIREVLSSIISDFFGFKKKKMRFFRNKEFQPVFSSPDVQFLLLLPIFMEKFVTPSYSKSRLSL